MAKGVRTATVSLLAARGPEGVGWRGMRQNVSDGSPEGFGPELWRSLDRREDLASMTSTLWTIGMIGEPCDARVRPPDPLYEHWLWIVDAQAGRLAWYVAVPANTSGRVPAGDSPVSRPDGVWDYGHCARRYELVGEAALSGPEPDWYEVRSRGYSLVDIAREKMTEGNN